MPASMRRPPGSTKKPRFSDYLSPEKATELANRLADDIGKLDEATLDELVAILGRKRQKPKG